MIASGWEIGRTGSVCSSKHRFVVWLVLLLLFPVSAVHAASLYPHSYRVQRHYIGSDVVPPVDTDEVFFAVKRQPFWAGEGTVISVWDQGASMRRGITLADGVVLCAGRVSGSSLVVLREQDNTTQFATIDTALAVEHVTVLPEQFFVPRTAVCRLLTLSTDHFLALLNGVLLYGQVGAENIQWRPVAAGVKDICLLTDPVSRKATGYAYASYSNRGTDIVMCDLYGTVLSTTVLQTQEILRLQPISARAVVVLEELAASSAVTIVEQDGIQTKLFLPASYEAIAIERGNDGGYILRYLTDDRAGMRIQRGTVNRGGARFQITETVVVPDFFINLLRLRHIGGVTYGVFQNGLLTLDKDGEILSADRINFHIDEDVYPDIRVVAGGSVLLAHPSGSFLLRREEHPFWWFHRLVADFLSSVLGVAALVIIVLLWRRLYRQRRLLRTLFEAPEAEPMLILDPECRLLQINDTARALLRIPPDVPMRRMLHSYLVGVTGLKELADEAITFRRRAAHRVEVASGGGEGDEYAFTAMPVFSFFRQMRWILITGRNITRELERKRISNWAQLAHDMQTNLSIIRLNAEKIIATVDDTPTERGKKILLQANLLINRVRDLVTIGRQDVLHISQVEVSELCAAVCEEFDPTFFPNIMFRIESPTVVIQCDRARMERALRNAVENAIRALQGKPGTIELSCQTDDYSVFFRIKDTGVGMDKQTQENMMRPFFTTFGKQGGTGMGTVIMRHVIQMHGGEMFVESEKGHGTTVIFRLPMRASNSVKSMAGEQVETGDSQMA